MWNILSKQIIGPVFSPCTIMTNCSLRMVLFYVKYFMLNILNNEVAGNLLGDYWYDHVLKLLIKTTLYYNVLQPVSKTDSLY